MYNLIKLNLARNSLRYIIRTYGMKEMHVPFYLCPVIRRALIKENCKPVFYHISDDFMPVDEFNEDAFILYPNYFGVCDKNVKVLGQKYKYLIIDNAHSFYSEPTGFACFNSARKFLNVYNGSYLWIKDNSLTFPKEKTFNLVPKNEEEMYKNERKFDLAEIETLNDIMAEEIEKADDLKDRKEVFLRLHENYGSINLLKIDESVKSPFCYPCLLKTDTMADELVQKLKSEGHRIYRYWEELPNVFSENKFFTRLVPVPLSKNL